MSQHPVWNRMKSSELKLQNGDVQQHPNECCMKTHILLILNQLVISLHWADWLELGTPTSLAFHWAYRRSEVCAA